jgi:ribosomal RNA-processing protein 7
MSKHQLQPLLLSSSQMGGLGRMLFVKSHSGKAADGLDADGRVLFVASTLGLQPPQLAEVFADAGEIEAVNVFPVAKAEPRVADAVTSISATTASVAKYAAHIRFSSSSSLKKALQLRVVPEPRLLTPTLAQQVQAHQESLPDAASLSVTAAAAVQEFDAKVAEERRKRERVVVDEDGFVLVTRKGKRGRNEEGGATVSTVTAAAAERAGKTRRSLTKVDFYRFQQREAKRNEIAELRSKFEADKARILQLRSQRKFRPM